MSFIDRPQSVFLRRALFQIHLWVGIATGLYIFVVCVTGSALVFRIDLQRALHPALFTPGAGPPADAATVMERVGNDYPQHKVSGLDAPTTARPTVLVYATQGSRFATILADPADGHVLGELPEQSFVRSLQDLHFDLLAGRAGRVINGAGALCLLVMCLTGSVIWWPGRRNWTRSLGVRVSGNFRRVNWDLHIATGFWTFLLIAMWAVTGAYFVFPSELGSMVNSVSPITVERAPASNAAGKGTRPQPTWRELIDIARARVPGQHIARIVVPYNDTAAFLVMFSDVAPTPVSGADLTSVYLDQFTGDVLQAAPRSERSTGDVVLAWLAPLHVGNFGGFGVRLVWALVGLAPPLLFVTGFTMWWTRVVRKRTSCPP